MKKKKTITIRNEKLKTLRNNLRLILIRADIEKRADLRRNKKRKELNKMREIADKSIIFCSVCQQADKDMTYNTQLEEWFCVDCYNGLPGNLKPEWKPKYSLTKNHIINFFNTLNEYADRIGSTFRYSREILKDMGISQKEQVKFLNICKEYGGYNDKEILMNVQKEIYSDFGIKS